MRTTSITISAPAFARIEAWLGARNKCVLAAIVLVAILVRVLVFTELARGPVLWQQRWAESDMAFFDEWARTIAAGDVLTDRELHPFVSWHHTLAERELAQHPEVAIDLAREHGIVADGSKVSRDRLERALWNRWYGGKQFHQEPLYPYLVALTYAVFGVETRAVLIWQLALGVLSCALVWSIARRAFDESTAALAGLSAASCAPLVFHELQLLRTASIVFALLALVWLAQRALVRERRADWIALGATLGAALLLNSTFMAFALGLALLLLVRERWRWQRLVQPLAALAGAALLVMSPCFVRNIIVGAPVFSTSSVGALAFTCANTGDFDPRNGFWVDSPHLVPILHASDNQPARALWATLATHAGIAGWFAQLGQKFSWAWRWYEMPNNESFDSAIEYSRTLGGLPLRFGLVAPFALVGLALASPRWRKCGPLFAGTFAALAPLLLFYVLSRFRAPLIAVLIPFAAWTTIELMRAIVERRFVRAGAILVLVMSAALWTSRPLPPGMERIRRADYVVPYATWYGPAAEAASQAGDWARAADLLHEYLAHEWPTIAEIGTSGPRRRARPGEAEMVNFAAKIRRLHAVALRKLGDAASAQLEELRANELSAALARGS